MGPLVPKFLTPGDVCPGFKSHSGFPHLGPLSPVCKGILKFTSGMTPADFLAASMAADPFHPHTCEQALMGDSLGSVVPLPHSVRQDRRSTD